VATMTIDEKKRIYWKIFYVLGALTVFELSITRAPIPHIYISLLVCIASVAKAFFVGWVYMHLNHETTGLKVILTAPLFVAFFYAVFLILDARVTQSRHTDPYIGQPQRFFGQRKLAERMVDDFGNTVVEEVHSIHMVEGDSHSASSVSSAGGTKDSGTLPAHAGTVKATTVEAAHATEENVKKETEKSASSEASKH
jgi:hypothetical protein